MRLVLGGLPSLGLTTVLVRASMASLAVRLPLPAVILLAGLALAAYAARLGTCLPREAEVPAASPSP